MENNVKNKIRFTNYTVIVMNEIVLNTIEIGRFFLIHNNS